MSEQTARDEKKQQFMEEYVEKSRAKRKRVIAISTAIIAIVIGVIWYINSTPYTSADGGNYFVEDLPSYQGKKVEMTMVQAEQQSGQVSIPISEVTTNKIVRFEYKSADPEHEFYGEIKGKMPIMAYLSTAGRLIVASSICEPCYGTEFYLQDSQLVCVACGTRWRNTDLFGEAGGCVKYPPEELKYSVEEGKIILSEELLNNWKPRFFTDDIMG